MEAELRFVNYLVKEIKRNESLNEMIFKEIARWRLEYGIVADELCKRFPGEFYRDQDLKFIQRYGKDDAHGK
jgi:hypothetical protein